MSVKSWLRLGCITLALILLVSSAFTPLTSSDSLRPPIVAAGFEMSSNPPFAGPHNVPEFAADAFTGPTSMTFDSRGRLFVGTFTGKILVLLDTDDDGFVDQVRQFSSGLGSVLGMAFRGPGDLYCTSNELGGFGSIVRLRDLNGDDIADETTTIVDNLPSQGDHQTNKLRFGPDGRIYFSQGSATDAGVPKPGRPAEGILNATIISFDPNSPQPAILASGLRNAFGIAFHPETGDLFATDGGSGEVCQTGNCPPEDLAPLEEVNWVIPGGNYGFPNCEGTPTPGRPECTGVRAPLIQYPQHLTPTSLTFYTGPQAGEFRNQLLLTLFKNLPNLNNFGGDLRRLILSGDHTTGFTLQDAGFIVQFDPIDPFDGPIDSAIDPITGDIYVIRFDPVHHPDPNEHHHFIYRIHRSGSDSLPFIGPIQPASVRVGSGLTTISIVGKHLKPGAVVFDVTDNVSLVTRQGADRFELAADIPANLLTSQRAITLEVRNQDGGRSNQQVLSVSLVDPPPPDDPIPQINSMFVYKKKRTKVVNPVTPVDNAKKHRLVVSGSDFGSGAELLVNGTPLLLETSSDTELVGRFGKRMLEVAGQLTVQVRTSTGKLSNIINLSVSP